MIVTFLGAMWGALTAYVILGGGFLATLLNVGNATGLSFAFATVAALLVFGGLGFVTKAQAVLLPMIFVLMAIMFVFALPHFAFERVLELHPENTMLPLGVILFAVGGVSAIPEMRAVLGGHERLLPRAVFFGQAVAIALYALFALVVIGMNGGATPPDAISGIGRVAGPAVGALAQGIGLLIMASAFMTLGTSLAETLHYDFRLRCTTAWALAVGVPVAAFALGARDFIGVIGATGGVFGGVIGLLIVSSYEKARRSGELPKRALRLPQLLVVLSGVLFATMIILTIA